MIHTEGYISYQQNENIYYQSWLPLTQPRAIILLVHGLGSHSGWYDDMARQLVDQNYGAYALDLYGHGKSSGQRGHIRKWSDYREHVHYFYDWSKSQQNDQPYFILGHSLGGLIALEYILKLSPSIQGLVLIAPALGKVGVSPFKIILGQLLSWIYPRFSLDLGFREENSTHDSQIILRYKHDRLRHTRATARFGKEFLKTVQWVQDNSFRLSNPILFLQGDEDVITLPDSNYQFFTQLPEIDKEYLEYQGGYHDLHHDFCQQIVIKDIINWLEKQS